MPKSHRLSRADFSQLVTLRKEQGRFFILNVARSPDTKAHFACVVSKKTAHKAHDRNLIKRRCRAALRQFRESPPFTYVFTAKRSAADSSYKDVSHDVSNLIVKVLAGLKGASGIQ